MKGIHYRILASLAVVAIIAFLGVMAQRYASLDWLVARETHLRKLVRIHPLNTWLIGLVIYTCLSLIPGLSGKSVVVGWLFGFWAAVLMIDLALTGAALITFFASRFLFREAVEARFGIHLGHFRRKLDDSAGFYLLMLRFLHAPFSFVNYAAGATNIVPAWTFWWTTQLGLLPGTMVFAFAGTRIPALSVIAERGVLSLLDRSLIAALLTIAILPIFIRWIAALIRRRFIPRHVDCITRSRQDPSGETHVGN